MSKTKESMKGKAEQRSEERYACAGTVLLYAPDAAKANDENGLHRARVQDMSLSGISFDVPEPLPVGRKLVLLIRQSDGKGQECLLAEVRWCEAVRKDVYRVGVRIEYSELGTETSIAVEDAPADSIVGVLTSYRQAMLDGGSSGKQ